MKKTRLSILIIFILTALMLVLAITFSGCKKSEVTYNSDEPIEYGNGIDDGINNEENDENESGESSDISDENGITETNISILEDGKTDFTIVISDSVSELTIKSANDLQDAFKAKLNVDINIRNEDYFKLLNNGSISGAKIVVGTLSDDSISVPLEKPLRDGEYVLKVTDGSLYILGGTDEATESAVSYFINAYLKPETKTLDFAPGVIYQKITSASISNMTIAGEEVWNYSIVYCDSEVARACADKIRAVIADLAGYTLPMHSDAINETEHEILVGKTNRVQSRVVRADYARPNVYYDIGTVGSKLVLMGEGYSTLNKVSEIFEEYLSTVGGFGASLEGSLKNGNIIDLVDVDAGENMVIRAEDTDLRVMHWNMAAPYLWSAGDKAVYTDNKIRGEIMADAILQIYPDIFTTNEFYKSHNGDSTLYNAVMGELGEYYNILDSEYEKGEPSENADVIPSKTINSNILYRKGIGLSVLSSGWRYASEKTDATETNPGGWVYYHGYHTAIFKTHYGDRFIVSVAHNADSRTDTIWTEEHLDAVNDAKAKLESSDNIPIILTGDMYTYVNHSASSSGAGYYYLKDEGYVDSQVSALVNANAPDGCIDSDNKKHGTFHDVGVHQIARASEDFIWTKNGISALRFKVLTFRSVEDTSDHYPVVADLEFN